MLTLANAGDLPPDIGEQGIQDKYEFPTDLAHAVEATVEADYRSLVNGKLHEIRPIHETQYLNDEPPSFILKSSDLTKARWSIIHNAIEKRYLDSNYSNPSDTANYLHKPINFGFYDECFLNTSNSIQSNERVKVPEALVDQWRAFHFSRLAYISTANNFYRKPTDVNWDKCLDASLLIALTMGQVSGVLLNNSAIDLIPKLFEYTDRQLKKGLVREFDVWWIMHLAKSGSVLILIDKGYTELATSMFEDLKNEYTHYNKYILNEFENKKNIWGNYPYTNDDPRTLESFEKRFAEIAYKLNIEVSQPDQRADSFYDDFAEIREILQDNTKTVKDRLHRAGETLGSLRVPLTQDMSLWFEAVRAISDFHFSHANNYDMSFIYVKCANNIHRAKNVEEIETCILALERTNKGLIECLRSIIQGLIDIPKRDYTLEDVPYAKWLKTVTNVCLSEKGIAAEDEEDSIWVDCMRILSVTPRLHEDQQQQVIFHIYDKIAGFAKKTTDTAIACHHLLSIFDWFFLDEFNRLNSNSETPESLRKAYETAQLHLLKKIKDFNGEDWKYIYQMLLLNESWYKVVEEKVMQPYYEDMAESTRMLEDMLLNQKASFSLKLMTLKQLITQHVRDDVQKNKLVVSFTQTFDNEDIFGLIETKNKKGVYVALDSILYGLNETTKILLDSEGVAAVDKMAAWREQLNPSITKSPILVNEMLIPNIMPNGVLTESIEDLLTENRAEESREIAVVLLKNLICQNDYLYNIISSLSMMGGLGCQVTWQNNQFVITIIAKYTALPPDIEQGDILEKVNDSELSPQNIKSLYSGRVGSNVQLTIQKSDGTRKRFRTKRIYHFASLNQFEHDAKENIRLFRNVFNATTKIMISLAAVDDRRLDSNNNPIWDPELWALQDKLYETTKENVILLENIAKYPSEELNRDMPPTDIKNMIVRRELYASNLIQSRIESSDNKEQSKNAEIQEWVGNRALREYEDWMRWCENTEDGRLRYVNLFSMSDRLTESLDMLLKFLSNYDRVEDSIEILRMIRHQQWYEMVDKFPYLPEFKRTGYAIDQRQQASNYTHRDEWGVAFALESIWQAKTIFPKLMKAERVWLTSEILENPELGKQLLEIRKQFSRINDEGHSLEESQALQEEVDGLRNIMLETSKRRPYATLPEVFDVLPKNLREGEVLVEYFKATPRPGNLEEPIEEPVFYAITVRPDGETSIHLLGTSNEIEQLSKKYLKMIVEQGNTYIYASASENLLNFEEKQLSKLGKKLADKIIAPLRLNSNDKTIIFATDGILDSLPFAALPMSSEDNTVKYLIEEFDICVTNAGNSLLNVKSDYDDIKHTRNELFVLANPQHNKKVPSKNQLSDLINTNVSVLGIRDNIDQLGDISNTEYLGLSVGENRKIFSKQHATETILNINNNSRVIVIGAHGLHQADDYTELNPLTGSIILLAPDSTFMPESNGRKKEMLAVNGDGILTAYEASNINLKNTKLVVLACCSTSIGQYKTGIGAASMGLAFQLAGAEDVVSSLWQIPENETVEQVNVFLKEYFENDNDETIKAFSHSQRGMLNQKRTKKSTGHPFWWAGLQLQYSRQKLTSN